MAEPRNAITCEYFVRREITRTNLTKVCKDIRKRNSSKVGVRVCQEIMSVVEKHGAQLVSWCTIHLDILTPVTFDIITFHDLNLEVKLDHKDILYSDLKLLRRISWNQLGSKHPDVYESWKQVAKENDELWEYEQDHGPPEWAVSEGLALLRDGAIFRSCETCFSF